MGLSKSTSPAGNAHEKPFGDGNHKAGKFLIPLKQNGPLLTMEVGILIMVGLLDLLAWSWSSSEGLTG
jgi:hypothetical protein